LLQLIGAWKRTDTPPGLKRPRPPCRACDAPRRAWRPDTKPRAPSPRHRLAEWQGRGATGM